jgi:DNA-binding MarR family transcriptional regulator
VAPKRSTANIRYEALLQLLRSADTIWKASATFFARWDLSPSQFNVLNLLHGCPDGLSQVDLSRELIMHRSNVTGLVDRLEKRGLVERHEAADDRRAYRVVLTRSGHTLLSQILPGYRAGIERVWKDIPAARATALTKDLQHVARKTESLAAKLSNSGNP